MIQLSNIFAHTAQKWWLLAPLLPAIGTIGYIIRSQIKGERKDIEPKP